MNGYRVIMVMSALFWWGGSVAAADCATGVVTTIRTGHQEIDKGSQVDVLLDSTGAKWWVLNEYYNLNDSPGYAHLDLLLESKLNKLKVTLSDSERNACNVFSAVTLN